MPKGITGVRLVARPTFAQLTRSKSMAASHLNQKKERGVFARVKSAAFVSDKRENSMTQMEPARKAGGSGKAFTTAVVLAIIACAAMFVWRFLF
jgi:hypothetical protein